MSLTMKELSQLSGIPRESISRVLNAFPHVSNALRERVTKAIEEYGYEPNIMAKALVTKRSNLVAFIVPTIYDCFFGEMIDRVEHCALEQGLNLLPFNSFFNPERERHLVTLARRLQAEALIIAPITVGGKLVNKAVLSKFPKPLVFFDRYASSRKPSILLNNAMTGKMAAEYLISLGHRRLAFLQCWDDPKNRCVCERRQGFIDAAQTHGLSLNPTHFLSLDWGKKVEGGFDYGYALLTHRLDDIRKSGITALFAHTDSIAMGAIHAILEAGLRVPDDLSIIGCDDMNFAAHTTPPLTTIGQPKEEMAKALIEALTTRPEPRLRKLVPTLIERQSCSAPRRA